MLTHVHTQTSTLDCGDSIQTSNIVVSICIHTCLHVYTCINTRFLMHIHKYTHWHMYTWTTALLKAAIQDRHPVLLYIYIYKCIYIHVDTFTNVCIHIFSFIYIRTHTDIYTHKQQHSWRRRFKTDITVAHVCVYTTLHVYTCIYIHIIMYIHMYTYLHIHTYTPALLKAVTQDRH